MKGRGAVGSSTQHGQQWINFELHEAELEAKVRRIAQVEVQSLTNDVLRTQLEMKKELDSRTKNMRDFVSTQVKQSQVSIEGLRDDMKFQASQTSQTLGAMQQAARSQSPKKEEVRRPQNQGRTLKRQDLEQGLMDDVKEALAAEKLDCKPIKGHDFPMNRGE